MPINNPNGNEVSEIVLPNGNTASEVIAPDGSKVFGILDGIDDYWPCDEGTGSTAANDLRSIDFSLSGAGWSSDSFGTYVTLDGSDDYMLSDNSSLGLNNEYGVGCWIEISSNSDAYAGVIKEDDAPSGNANDGLVIDTDDGTNPMRFRNRDSGGTNSIDEYSYSFDTRLFVAQSTDTNDNGEAYVWDESTQQFSSTATAAFGNGIERLLIGSVNNNYLDAKVYEIYSSSSFVPESDWSAIWNDTKSGVS